MIVRRPYAPSGVESIKIKIRKKIKETFVKTLKENVGKKKKKHKLALLITQTTSDRMDERKRVNDKLKRTEHALRQVGTKRNTGQT